MTQLDVSSDRDSRPHMGGAREPSPLMETKCSSKRSPVPPSASLEEIIFVLLLFREKLSGHSSPRCDRASDKINGDSCKLPEYNSSAY